MDFAVAALGRDTGQWRGRAAGVDGFADRDSAVAVTRSRAARIEISQRRRAVVDFVAAAEQTFGKAEHGNTEDTDARAFAETIERAG